MRKIEFIDDCIKLQEIALKLGYAPSLYEIEEIWEVISEESSAGWLGVDAYLGTDNVWIVKVLQEKLEEFVNQGK